MTNQAKVVLSAEDRSAAAFATFARGLDKAGLSANAFKSNVASLLAGISVGALATFTKNIINSVDALNDVADATGSTVENISALEDVARRTGTNMEVVSSALVKFNATLKDADPSKGPGAVLKALNLDISDLKRQDPAEALRQVAVALSGYADDGNKARAVQELFGKSVKEAAPFLKDLAENGQLNAKVTTEQAAEAEKFNKELFKLQANANDAARAIVGSLVPAINRIFEDVRTLGDKATLAGLAGSVIDLKRDLDILKEKRGNPFFNQEAIEKQISDITAKFDAAKKAFNDARGYRPAGGGRGFVNPEVVRPELDVPPDAKESKKTTTLKDPYADANRYLDGLKKQIEETQNLTVYEKLLTDLREGRLGKTTAAMKEELKATARQVDSLHELAKIDAVLADNDAKAAKSSEERAAALQALISATPTAKLEEQRSVMIDLAKALEDGAISTEQFTEAAQTYLGTAPNVTDELKRMTQAAVRANERIQDALGDQLFNLLDGRFDDIGDAFENMLKRMAAEAAAASIMDSLFGSVGSDKTRSGGLLGSVGTAILGSFLPSFDGGGHTGYGARAGGLDGKGGALYMLHPRERVLDETKGQGIGGGGGSVVINIYNTIGSVASQADVVAGMQQTRAQIMGELQRRNQYGVPA